MLSQSSFHSSQVCLLLFDREAISAETLERLNGGKMKLLESFGLKEVKTNEDSRLLELKIVVTHYCQRLAQSWLPIHSEHHDPYHNFLKDDWIPLRMVPFHRSICEVCMQIHRQCSCCFSMIVLRMRNSLLMTLARLTAMLASCFTIPNHVIDVAQYFSGSVHFAVHILLQESPGHSLY